MQLHHRIVACLATLLLTLPLADTIGAQTTSPSSESASADKVSYMPQIHGVVRGRFEQSTVENVHRFQVRNARVSIGGKAAAMIDYYVMADLCDRGKMKILDAWGRLSPVDGLAIQLGQFRMPFGIESFLAPQTYYFANRSYMGKDMCNYRAVGGKIGYTLPRVPLTIEGGVFNPTTIGDHTGWHRPMAYATKLVWRPGDFTVATGFMSIDPDSIRGNLVDAAITWKKQRLTIAAEYMYEHYTHRAHKAAHSYVVQADYALPIHAWQFNQLSFQGRFDGITNYSNLNTNAAGQLVTNTQAANRITVGSTLSYIRKPGMHADVRLNYEKMFFHRGVRPTPDMGDKLVAELVIAF